MAAPHIAKKSLVEYGLPPKLHRVEDLEVGGLVEAEFYENTGQFPLSAQDKPRMAKALLRMGWSEQIAGSGTAGTPPPIHDQLLTLPFSYVNVPSTSDVYTLTPLTSAMAPPFTPAVYIGNAVRYMGGAGILSSARIEYRTGEPIKFVSETVSLYNSPVEATSAAALVTGATPVIAKAMATANLGGDALFYLKEATIDLGVETVAPESMGNSSLLGYERPVVVNIEPMVEVLFQFPDFSMANYYTDMSTETPLELELTAGTAAGNIFNLTVTLIQNEPPEVVDEEGLYHVRIRGRMGWGAGQPLVLSFT